MADVQQNYYEVLGLEPGAELKAIKTAYYKLAKTKHPDTTRDAAKKAELETEFMAISDAYQVLSDPDRRKAYDAMLAMGMDSEMARSGADAADVVEAVLKQQQEAMGADAEEVETLQASSSEELAKELRKRAAERDKERREAAQTVDVEKEKNAARVYAGAGKYLEAAMALDKIIRASSTAEPEMLQMQAIYYLQANRSQQAKNACNEAIVLSPEYYGGYLAMGLILEKSGAARDALNYYREAKMRADAAGVQDKRLNDAIRRASGKGAQALKQKVSLPAYIAVSISLGLFIYITYLSVAGAPIPFVENSVQDDFSGSAQSPQVNQQAPPVQPAPTPATGQTSPPGQQDAPAPVPPVPVPPVPVPPAPGTQSPSPAVPPVP